MKTYTNIILISGNARNVGKTTLACRIIKYFSKSRKVIALKITPHFHETGNRAIKVLEKDKFVVFLESEINSKDSSRMLQAGAYKSYFVKLERGSEIMILPFIKEISENEIIIIESGGLNKLIIPALSFFVNEGSNIDDNNLPDLSNTIVLNRESIRLFNPKNIKINGGVISYDD